MTKIDRKKYFFPISYSTQGLHNFYDVLNSVVMSDYKIHLKNIFGVSFIFCAVNLL